MAASSTGKYHPPYALGKGGLVRHTKAAVRFAHDLLTLEMSAFYFTQQEKDIMITAIILHDGLKHGLPMSKFTIATHPLEVCKWLADEATSGIPQMLTADEMNLLTLAISSHMGEWNTDYKSKQVILPKPESKTQCFVHMCDYLASRKHIIFQPETSYQFEDYEVKEPAKPIELTEIQQLVKDIVDSSKELKAQGVEIGAIIKAITTHHTGSNPNSIHDVAIAKLVLEELRGLRV